MARTVASPRWRHSNRCAPRRTYGDVVVLPATFPDLIALDIFCSAVALGSLGRAAEAHGIAQPSASARMRQLERQLGVALLHRSATGSTPTEAGVLVAEWAAGVLAAAHRLEAGVDSLRARDDGRLRISASLTVAEYLLPGWLMRVRRAYPNSPIELEVTNSTRVLEAVAGGRADLGFIESPGSTNGLPAATVGGDELVVVVGPDHAWARRRSPLPAAALASVALVVREAGSGTRDALALAMSDIGLVPVAPAAELGSTAAVKAVVGAGSGPAVLSRLAVAAELGSGALVEVEVAGITLARQLRAVWPVDHAPEGAAAAMLDVAKRP